MGYSSWFVLVSWCRPGAVYLLYVNLGQFISIGGSFNTVCRLGALVTGGSCTWGQLSLGAVVPGGSCRPGAVVATGQLSPGAAVGGGSCRRTLHRNIRLHFFTIINRKVDMHTPKLVH